MKMLVDYKYNTYRLIVLTFIATALYDVVLRKLSLYNIIPSVKTFFPFIQYLEPYFMKHTMLAAALIAGIVGATTQVIILYFMKFPTRRSSAKYIIQFMTWTFIASALYGFIMKWSKLFPYLEEYYYKPLGLFKSLYHDGTSGLIVQFTLLFFLQYTNDN
jgi:hypothetical protein